MKKSRLEAFSDGVLAIVITIMVLEMKVPEGADFKALNPLVPVFLTYLGSFVYLGIYWNNHHHLIQAIGNVNGRILWANLNLLFWLSLFPFVTGWMGENHFERNPVALYGFVLLMAAIAYKILTYYVIQSEGKTSIVGMAVEKNRKEYKSIILYAVAVIVSFFQPVVSVGIYILVAVMWFVPDKRIEKRLMQ